VSTVHVAIARSLRGTPDGGKNSTVLGFLLPVLQTGKADALRA